jgi:hypothetical protein
MVLRPALGNIAKQAYRGIDRRQPLPIRSVGVSFHLGFNFVIAASALGPSPLDRVEGS